MKYVQRVVLIFFAAMIQFSCNSKSVEIKGEFKEWHKITFEFNGPHSSELSTPNPFLDYRLNATFTNGDKSYIVPGFYAADGNAAETSAAGGNRWQVRFCPDATGEWHYRLSFRTGRYIAVSDSADEGMPVAGDGMAGTFTVGPADTEGPFSKGKLRYIGQRYLQYAETGAYFLKAGADSPENFLAYGDFDGTYYAGNGRRRMGEAEPNQTLHRYVPHAGDWREGDPAWQNGKGKNIIGALNYLASEGMNSVYFLTMNFHGDGKDVWPWIDPYERTRFDCSKLDQWEMVFDHMDRLGIMLHVVTQETENELVLDNGYTGVLRKLYYRELIARFGHHLALTWNLGEENGPAPFTLNAQNDEMRKQMAEYIKTHDPYQNFVVVHTHSNRESRDPILTPLVGFKYIDGPSFQIGNAQNVHRDMIYWINTSAGSNKQWVCCLDEIGGADTGVKPDIDDPGHDWVRINALWGNLMAGGAGCEWYFGYKYAHNDLNCEDWRSRARMWHQSKIAIDFFINHVPFAEMYAADQLVSGRENWCFAKPGDLYVIYLPEGGTTQIKLEEGTYRVNWYNPRVGGDLLNGPIQRINGPGIKTIGSPPHDPSKDWVVLVQNETYQQKRGGSDAF
jgi:hypothetical protein